MPRTHNHHGKWKSCFTAGVSASYTVCHRWTVQSSWSQMVVSLIYHGLSGGTQENQRIDWSLGLSNWSAVRTQRGQRSIAPTCDCTVHCTTSLRLVTLIRLGLGDLRRRTPVTGDRSRRPADHEADNTDPQGRTRLPIEAVRRYQHPMMKFGDWCVNGIHYSNVWRRHCIWTTFQMKD